MKFQSGTAYELGKTYHIGIGLDFIRRVIKAGAVEPVGEYFTHRGGKPATKKEVLAQLDKLEAQDYEVYPSCDRADSKGRCKGHKGA